VTLEIVGQNQLSFVAGQYIQIFLPGTQSLPEPIYRAYSMASSPTSPRRLTLFVRREPGGVVSPYLCDRLQEGEELAIRGPFGDFRLHEGSREILFIAGGSGLAPIRSMLVSMAERASARRSTLYFSVRSKRDLFLFEEFHAMESVLPFRFIPALSNPLPSELWNGEKGGITAVLNRRLDRLDNYEAYLCGSAGMIDAAVRVLHAKGLSDERVFFDKFL
jgi:Na+-transporting NADH:ubiquinone oxidoreductase subunit F